jgi:hypothetical protein
MTSKTIRMPEQIALIVSTGRTATQALAHYLDSCYPQVCALHEPSPSRVLRLVSNRYLSGNIGKERAVESFLRKRESLLGAFGSLSISSRATFCMV